MLAMLEEGKISKIHIQNIVRDDYIVSEAIVSTPNHTYRLAVGNVDTFKNRVETFNNRGGFKVILTESREEELSMQMNILRKYA